MTTNSECLMAKLPNENFEGTAIMTIIVSQRISITRAFFLSTRAFFSSTRAFFLSTRAFFLSTRAFFSSTCAFFSITRAFFSSTRDFFSVTGNNKTFKVFKTLRIIKTNIPYLWDCGAVLFAPILHRQILIKFYKRKF